MLMLGNLQRSRNGDDDHYPHPQVHCLFPRFVEYVIHSIWHLNLDADRAPHSHRQCLGVAVPHRDHADHLQVRIRNAVLQRAEGHAYRALFDTKPRYVHVHVHVPPIWALNTWC
jgi:hypothetical protein